MYVRPFFICYKPNRQEKHAAISPKKRSYPFAIFIFKLVHLFYATLGFMGSNLCLFYIVHMHDKRFPFLIECFLRKSVVNIE